MQTDKNANEQKAQQLGDLSDTGPSVKDDVSAPVDETSSAAEASSAGGDQSGTAGLPGCAPDSELVEALSATSRFAPPQDLSRFAWLSILTSLVIIAMKTVAWLVTGSVSLLSDAAESLVNVAAAVVALIALKVAIRPPDSNHHFGHSKAEYFSAMSEGTMIFLAAGIILYSSVERFFNPRPLGHLGIGIGISILAGVLNCVVAVILIRAGRQHRSSTLVADGKHLMTDVITSVAVLIGVVLVWVTGIERLDPIVAFIAGLNILWTGAKLLKESSEGLMDIALPAEDVASLHAILDRFVTDQVIYHAVRTRESGNRRFLEFHLLMPGEWSVQVSHDLVEKITAALTDEYPDLRVLCHVEPIEDPASYEDILI